MLSSKSLLTEALKSLDTDPIVEKRKTIFSTNQKVIVGLNDLRPELFVGSLKIKPSIDGEADAQPAHPLASSDTYEIDISKINAQNGTLKEVIQRLCRENQIEVNDKLNTASCTAVVAVLPGQHAQEDADCTDVTSAEFVPVFYSGYEQKRVLALSYSLNGETGLKVDHMRVTGEMTCLGRHTLYNKKAFKAIEIPNAIAEEMSREQPELFNKLQKQACLVAFVEYDLIPPTPVYRGGDFGLTRGGEDSFATRGGSRGGVSAYSVVGSGTTVRDHSTTATEVGTRRLKRISVYLVGAMVINTNNQMPTASQCEKIHSLMKMRAQELSHLYGPWRIYTFNQLHQDLEKSLQPFGISVTNTDIFEHSLLRLASIDEDPTGCHFDKSTQTPENFFVDLGLSRDATIKFVENLQRRFERGFCEYTPTFNRNGLQAVRFPLAMILKYMPTIQESIHEILSVPRNLEAYQRYHRQESSLYTSTQIVLDKVVKKFGISMAATQCLERVFLNMFGCDEQLEIQNRQPGKGYVGRMMTTRFLLGISEATALRILETIKQTFPELKICPAAIVSTNTIVKGSTYCEIEVDNTFLQSQPFLTLFEQTLNHLAEENPSLIDDYRVQSGTQKKPTSVYMDDLNAVALHYQVKNDESVDTGPKSRLAQSLQFFSKTVAAKPVSKRQERNNASDDLRRAIAFFESTQTCEENLQFKAGDKKIIKEVQHALTW